MVSMAAQQDNSPFKERERENGDRRDWTEIDCGTAVLANSYPQRQDNLFKSWGGGNKFKCPAVGNLLLKAKHKWECQDQFPIFTSKF